MIASIFISSVIVYNLQSYYFLYYEKENKLFIHSNYSFLTFDLGAVTLTLTSLSMLDLSL